MAHVLGKIATKYLKTVYFLIPLYSARDNVFVKLMKLG